MDYSYIINPLTNRKVSIYSRKGHSILKEYVTQLGGDDNDCKLNPTTNRCGHSRKHTQETDECREVPKTPERRRSCRRVNPNKTGQMPHPRDGKVVRNGKRVYPSSQDDFREAHFQQEHSEEWEDGHCKKIHKGYDGLTPFLKNRAAQICRDDINCTWQKNNQCHRNPLVKQGPKVKTPSRYDYVHVPGQ